MIDTIQIGITTRCNGHCKFCLRNELLRTRDAEKMRIYREKIDLPFDSFKNIFKTNTIQNIQFCRNKGDAIFHPEFQKFIDCIKDNNRKFTLATNASIFTNEWWYNLGKNYKCDVVFALDGLEDTHKLYRGTDFKTVFEHMKSFIDGGGYSSWQFIVFKHNEHQVEEAKTIAYRIGCKKFIKVVSRFYDEEFEKPTTTFNLTKREINKNIKSKFDKEKYPKIYKLFNDIECEWKRTNRIYIDSRGYVYPCCFSCCHLQDYYTWDKYIYLKEMVETKEHNIMYTTLDNIQTSTFFKQIYNNINELTFCSVHCTKKNIYKNLIRREQVL